MLAMSYKQLIMFYCIGKTPKLFCSINLTKRSGECHHTSSEAFFEREFQPIELTKVGAWGTAPLGDFQYFTESELSKLLYFNQKATVVTLIRKHILSAPVEF